MSGSWKPELHKEKIPSQAFKLTYSLWFRIVHHKTPPELQVALSKFPQLHSSILQWISLGLICNNQSQAWPGTVFTQLPCAFTWDPFALQLHRIVCESQKSYRHLNTKYLECKIFTMQNCNIVLVEHGKFSASRTVSQTLWNVCLGKWGLIFCFLTPVSFCASLTLTFSTIHHHHWSVHFKIKMLQHIRMLFFFLVKSRQVCSHSFNEPTIQDSATQMSKCNPGKHFRKTSHTTGAAHKMLEPDIYLKIQKS